MELEWMKEREAICDVCHKMWQLGWVASNDGNVSLKLPDGTFLATPTGISKSFVTPEKSYRLMQMGNSCGRGRLPSFFRNENALSLL